MPAARKTRRGKMFLELFTPCSHPISARLAKGSRIKDVCPACFIARATTNIENVQKDLRERGGVFKSRGDERHKPKAHRVLIAAFRSSKKHGANLVDRLISLIEDPRMELGEKRIIKEALEIWDKAQAHMWKIPGHMYEEDVPGLTNGDKETIRLMMEALRKTVLDLLAEAEREDVAMKIHQSPCLGGQDGPTTQQNDFEEKSYLEPLLPTTIRSLHYSGSGKHQSFGGASPSSCLKRKTLCEPASSSSKRVHFTDFATVSSEHLSISNPSPFHTISRETTVQPHREITMAEKKRCKKSFQRKSRRYSPGMWASDVFSEKANTSFHKVKWEKVTAIARNEDEELQQEIKVVETFHAICGAWLLLWWMAQTRNTAFEQAAR